MSLNRTSLDTEVLILRRMYAMSTANIPVSTNYILGAGPAGQAYFQNTLQNISTYGIDLSSTISTIYGQIAAVSLSGGVSYPYFISTISGLYLYIDSQDGILASTFSTSIAQVNSTISGLTVSGSVSELQFTSTVSGIYGYISTISTNQGATISTNYTTLSGQISSINGYNSTYSTNIGGLISSFDTRISTNTTNISTVNNYLDQRISSLSALQISSYVSLSTMIEQAIVSSAFDQLSSFSTQINTALISTTVYLTNNINDVSGSVSTLKTQVNANTYNIGQLSSLVSTNYVSSNIFITSTGQGIYYNPYFQTNTTISGSLSMITGGAIDASGSSTFTRALYVSHASTDLSSVSVSVNNNYGKQFGNATNTSRAVIYDFAEYSSTNKGTLALYDINNATISSNKGPSIIFGGLYTDDKLWYRAKISAVASPSADASGSVIGGGDIVFTTKDNNNTYTMTDKMRIMHNGNVIIGPQLSTTQKLYVHGSATFESTIFTSTASATSMVTNTLQANTISCNTVLINDISINTLKINTISSNTIVNNSTITYTRSGIQYPLAPVIIEIKSATSLSPKVSTLTDIPSLSYTIPVSGYYQYTVQIAFLNNLSTPVYGDGIMIYFNISGLGVYLPGGYNTSSVLKGYDNLGQILYTATIGYRFTAGQILRVSHAEIGTFTYTSASIAVTYVLVSE